MALVALVAIAAIGAIATGPSQSSHMLVVALLTVVTIVVLLTKTIHLVITQMPWLLLSLLEPTMSLNLLHQLYPLLHRYCVKLAQIAQCPLDTCGFEPIPKIQFRDAMERTLAESPGLTHTQALFF